METLEIQRTVRIGDCENDGIMSARRYIDYMVEAVFTYQESRVNTKAVNTVFKVGESPPSTCHSIEIISPLKCEDRIDLTVTCTKVGSFSLSCNVEARRMDRKLAFRGEVTQFIALQEAKGLFVPSKEIQGAFA